MKNERYSRQSFLGPHSGEVLGASRVAIIGLGGGGSHVVQQLAHLGVGNFVLFDYDRVEWSNLNRMVGASSLDARAGRLKTSVARRAVRRVNQRANVVSVEKRWQERAEMLRDCDVIFGCVDAFSEREQIEIYARRYLIPYIDIGMDVHPLGDEFVIAGQVVLSMPGELCMKCLRFLRDDLLAQEAAKYGAAGPRPQVVWPNGVLASLAVGIFAQLVTPWQRSGERLVYLEYDGNYQSVAGSNLLKYVGDKRCPHFSSLQDLGDPFWANP